MCRGHERERPSKVKSDRGGNGLPQEGTWNSEIVFESTSLRKRRKKTGSLPRGLLQGWERVTEVRSPELDLRHDWGRRVLVGRPATKDTGTALSRVSSMRGREAERRRENRRSTASSDEAVHGSMVQRYLVFELENSRVMRDRRIFQTTA